MLDPIVKPFALNGHTVKETENDTTSKQTEKIRENRT